LQGNYVLAVAGGTVGANVWRMGYVYQWTGIRWEERSPESHSELYIRCFKDGLAVPELTQDMAWFLTLFTYRLFAVNAFIENLESQLITILENGAIISQGFNGADGNVPGFGLWAQDGRFEANSAKLKEIRILGNSYFEGAINSGRLYSSNTPTGIDVPPITFTANQTAKNVYDYFNGSGLGVSGSFTPTGGTAQTIYSIQFDWEWVPAGGNGIGGGGLTRRYNVRMATLNGTSIVKTWSENQTNPYLGGTLVIDGGKIGPTLRLNLPNGYMGLQPTEVYQDDSGYVRIKKSSDPSKP